MSAKRQTSRLRHLPSRMELGRDFVMFRPAGSLRWFYWFCKCPLCGLRAAEPSNAADGVELIEYRPGGSDLAIPIGLHTRCARAIDGRTGGDDLRVRIVGLACLLLLEALDRAAGVSRATFAPGSKVAS